LSNRPRTDESHLATDDIQELGKLVDLGPSERAADGSHHALGHRSELQNSEGLSVQTHSRLREEWIAAAEGYNRHRSRHEDRHGSGEQP
jgi:hypothetical protein